MVPQVVCVAHSSTSIDGRSEGPSRAYWVALVKDVEQKGYFIRIVDKEVRTNYLNLRAQDDLMSFCAEQRSG